jgi:ABC-type polysaccharide/polyol phosphate export permease
LDLKLRKSKRIITRTIAFARREFKLRTRYKWPYISITIVIPILHALPLIILYAGLLAAVPEGIAGLTPERYLTWVLLGSVIYSTFSAAYQIFRGRFAEEKFWMTIQGTLIAPASKYYLLFGVIIEITIRGFVTSIVFFVLSYIAYPASLLNIFLVMVIFLIGLMIGTSLGLIWGTLYLINENLAPIFEYILYILVFLSCYSIPFELYPEFLQLPIYVNPLYQLINLSRVFWFGDFSVGLIGSFFYVLIFCIVCMIVGVYFFTKYTRRFGVRGY